MPIFFLTSSDGSTAKAFDPTGDDVVRVETRCEDGTRSADYMDREEAREAWALMVRAGAVRTGGWPVHLSDPEPHCEDPESHDGEECDCAWKRAQGWTYCNEYTPGGAGWRRLTPES